MTGGERPLRAACAARSPPAGHVALGVSIDGARASHARRAGRRLVDGAADRAIRAPHGLQCAVRGARAAAHACTLSAMHPRSAPARQAASVRLAARPRPVNARRAWVRPPRA
ncbi:hypothetical protein D8O27_18760 [Burkholderia mallei]|nr:hypothetical protein D8O04_18590 [Burkholderia mallei]RKO15268.1 hypothetical protein D8O30_23420 [Burkholderia mallei]RKO27887.1 hypothetical protein D8O27_18760 [Burkholderia mallei]RKO35360.1 hypothetical protein D8O06_24200 [Burkholderia mallei]